MEQSQAFHARDREMILGAVRSSVGFTRVNAEVKARLREWFHASGASAVAGAMDERARRSRKVGVNGGGGGGAASLAHPNVSNLSLGSPTGSWSSASAASNTPRSWALKTNYAAMLLRHDKLAQAEPIMRRELSLRRSRHGEGHAKVTTAKNNLAALLSELGRHEEARALYQQVTPNL